MDFVILRFGSIYGPRSGPSNGLFRIVRAALVDGQLSYSGSAEAVREYIHVADVAQACLDAASGPFSNGSLVITGRESTSVPELLLTIAEIVGLDPRSVRFANSTNPGHYVRTPYADVPRLSRKYTPALHVDLGQGLLDLVEYVRSGLAASPGSAERGHDRVSRPHA